jgi:hypothetical protein
VEERREEGKKEEENGRKEGGKEKDGTEESFKLAKSSRCWFGLSSSRKT